MSSLDDLPQYRSLPVTAGGDVRSAWGVFGPEDELGSVNLLRPDLVQRAARLVRWGAVFPLNWSVSKPDPALFGRRSPRHVARDLEPGTDDWFDDFHTQASSHWMALRHVAHPHHGYYNDLPLEDETDLGAPRLGIEHWAQRGIVGRFVLADIERSRRAMGRALPLNEPTSIGIAEVGDVLATQGTMLGRGDILLIRTGWVGWYERLSLPDRQLLAARESIASPGLMATESTAEWLWDHQVAAVATDAPMLEVMTPEQGLGDTPLLHRVVAMLGIAVGGLFNLEALGHDGAVTGVNEGMFVAAPLNVLGGSGSPANAVAIK